MCRSPRTKKDCWSHNHKGEDISFDAPGASIKSGMLSASVKKTPYEVPLDQIQRFWVRRHAARGANHRLVAP